MPTRKTPVKKTSTRKTSTSAKKKSVSVKKKKTVSSAKKKKSNGVVTSGEKKQFMADIKETMSSLGRVPRLVFAPIASYAASKYDKIPKERRSKFSKTMKGMREGTENGFSGIKNRFSERGKDVKKGTTKKKTTKTKTKAKKKTRKTTKKK